MREPPEQEYFREYVEPHLSDRIEYLGEVNHGEKVELLQNARATLFPIEWEEPFGLVMIESMACGTPVIATRWGAVPEVIEHGATGMIVDHYRDMPAALEEADRLDPLEIRRSAEERFSPERMVADYVRAYRARAGRARTRRGRRRGPLRLRLAGSRPRCSRTPSAGARACGSARSRPRSTRSTTTAT